MKHGFLLAAVLPVVSLLLAVALLPWPWPGEVRHGEMVWVKGQTDGCKPMETEAYTRANVHFPTVANDTLEAWLYSPRAARQAEEGGAQNDGSGIKAEGVGQGDGRSGINARSCLIMAHGLVGCSMMGYVSAALTLVSFCVRHSEWHGLRGSH